MSVLRSLLTAGVLASGLLWSLNGITATPAAQASGDRYEVTQQRNPDAACLDCHKPDTEGMHGKHASVINPNNKLPVTCTNCHGQPSYNQVNHLILTEVLVKGGEITCNILK